MVFVEKIWFSLRKHGISEPLIWIWKCVYYGQTGIVRERDVDNCRFDIRGGVHQGCVLSPSFVQRGDGNGLVLMACGNGSTRIVP